MIRDNGWLKCDDYFSNELTVLAEIIGDGQYQENKATSISTSPIAQDCDRILTMIGVLPTVQSCKRGAKEVWAKWENWTSWAGSNDEKEQEQRRGRSETYEGRRGRGDITPLV